MASPSSVQVDKLEGVVLTVYVSRQFRARQWIAVQLIRVAAWVLGGRIEVRSE